MTSDNLAFGDTFEKEHLSDAIKTAAKTLVNGGKGGPLKVAEDYVNDGMKVDTHSSFGERIKELFAKITPQKIIETGTYLGTGTTTIIAQALKGLGIKDTVFYTIEVNPEYYAKAKRYFRQNNIEVHALNGLSVPRTMLPSREEIARKTITDIEYDDIFVDHEAGNRAQLYYDETNFANVEDDMLGRSLKAFEYKPDFVLLDSAGHMGNIEFNYLVERLRGPCYIALDDIYHIKHHRSFRQIQGDPRFEVITASKEKFGFCIARFTPNRTAKGPVNGLSAMPVAAPVGKEQTGAPGKRNLAGLSVAEFEEFLKNKVGTAENHRDVADVLELLTPDQYLPDDIRLFRETGKKDTNVWTTISILNAISKHFKIDNYLEIGVRRGRSLCQMLAHGPDVDVYAFDLWIENYAGAENPGPEFVQSEMTRVGYKKKINFYSGDSGELLPKFFRDPNTPHYFDVIYVDGDHSYEGALKDLHNVIGHLKPGGILLFDDVNHPQHKYLAKVWDTIKAENPNLAYYECNYGYGLCIGLNKEVHCSDGRLYINANDCGNVAGTGASVSGTTKAVSEPRSIEVVPRVSADSPSSKVNRKVLIVRPDSIGDFVIFSGVLHYFRKLYSNAHICLLVQENIAELAHGCPHIDEVILFDRKSAVSDRRYFNTLIEQLRARKFDVAINPVYSRTVLDDSIVLKSAALEKIAFIGDNSNMDMGQKLLNDTYYDKLVPATDGLLIETKRNEEFIRGLGAPADSSCAPTIWLKPQDRDYINSLLNELGIRKPIVVCPFAQAEYRQWPIHKWAQLLSHYRELPVLICGANEDKNEADLLIDLTGHTNIHNICGKTNLRQLAALFSKSRLCVASESGTAHIAAAMDCPQVVVIGGGHFGRFMPYSPTTNIVYLPMDCYNCNWKCPYWRWEIYCITQVSVGAVDKAVREVLTKPYPPEGQPRFFKDVININSSSILAAPALHIAENVQNDTNEPVLRCWCGGKLSDSVHPLYGLCTDCATLVLKKKPTKKQLRELYSMDGYWHEQMGINKYPQIEQRAISDFADRIPVWFDVLIKHRARPENLLEIGCGHGGFLHYCRQRGVNNVVGVEVDEGVCEFAHNYFNLPNIVCGLFPDVSLPSDKFDVIVGFDVLEHLTDPIRALTKIASLLRDDGVCLFQIPCYRGESAEWVQFRPGEHVYLFNNESVRRLFEAGGLEVNEVSCGYFTDDIFVVASRKMAAQGAAFAGDKNIKKSTTDVLVTAIVSTYNSEDCIAHCLQDLEEQTIADELEIIVVDSGSPQNEGAIVKAFQQKHNNIKYVRTENRETINKAWNRAIRMASGKYITNANTDDTHRTDALEILARALEESPDAVLAYANQGCVDKVDGKPLKEFIAGKYSRYRMLAEWCYISSHPMWRKDVHREFGYFDEIFIACGDWEFWLRISQKYDFVYINETLGNRRWTEDCLSRKSFAEGMAIIEAELLRKCYHYALETEMVVDYRGISANPVFSSWPEVNLWKQKVQAKRSDVIFNPESNIKDIHDYREESTPRLSIVITSYNNLSALQANLVSLNEQTEDRFEVIVVNSGQIIPEPGRMAKQLKYGFCCVEIKQDLGPSFAKNIGIKQAKGKYVAFLDDETIAQKDFARHILGHFSNPEVYGLRGRVLPKDGVKLRHIPSEYDLGEEVVFTACEVGTNCAFRKDMLDRVGGFNENLFGYEVQELSYRIFKEDGENFDSILYFPDVVVYHKPVTGNLPYYVNQMKRRIGKKLAEYKWPGVESYIEFARNQYPHRRKQLEKDYIQLLNMALLLQRRHPQQALKWAEKAVAINPDGIACRYTLGSLYLRLGKYNEARVILEKISGPLEDALVNGYLQFSNVENNFLSQIACCYVSTCTELAQCYIKQGKYDKVRQVYTSILNKPYLSMPPDKKASILNVLRKLDKTPPAMVFTEKQNNIATPAAKAGNGYLVSAIVSTYNSEKFLRGCLADLENQTIADKLEIIVVNSASEQDEEAIVKEFQKKYNNIVYIKTDKREGLYSAWNRAVKVASGLFLTSANTDDRHRKDALEIMADALLASPAVALGYGDQIVTDTPNPTFENHHVVEMAKRAEFSKQRLLFGCCVGSQPMWRKSLHDEFGCFDETLTCAADWDFWLKVARKYRFKHIPEFLGLYYHNKDGIEHGQRIHSLYERYAVGRRYGNLYISVIPLHQAQGNPLVSVVMAAYNSADYIARAIESVLIQNYRNFELIVVDDGSTDGTADIVQRFKGEPIKYFFKENGGVASARNFGLQKACGSFIVMLDSDDMMTPDYIARHLQGFEQHPEADMVYCDDCLIDDRDRPIRVINRPEYSDPKAFISDLFRCGFPVVHFKTCIRRSVFDKIGLYDERLIVAEDYDMMRRFVKQNLRMHHLPAALYLRRLTESSLSRSFNADKAKSHFEVVRRFTETFAPEQLFPDIQWNNSSAEQKLLLAKCKTALVYLGIGEQYVSNAPDYAATAFEMACAQLDECCKIEPANQQVRNLREKCLSIRAARLPVNRRGVCQPV